MSSPIVEAGGEGTLLLADSGVHRKPRSASLFTVLCWKRFLVCLHFWSFSPSRHRAVALREGIRTDHMQQATDSSHGGTLSCERFTSCDKKDKSNPLSPLVVLISKWHGL
jgi:hypothetical protein